MAYAGAWSLPVLQKGQPSPPQLPQHGRLVEVLRPSLRNWQVANTVKIPVFDGNFPATVRLADLPFEDVLHDLLPGASAKFGIGAIHVHARQREIEMRLVLGVVMGLEEPLRFVRVACFEAGLVSSGFVLEVINAPGALDQSELLLHRFVHGYECEAVGTER